MRYFASSQVKVEKIHFEGLQRTRNDIVSKHVQDLFKAKNFQDVSKNTHCSPDQDPYSEIRSRKW